MRRLTRRGFLGSSLALIPTLDAANSYSFHHDHVMGTSLDLVIHAQSAGDARAAHAAIFDEIERLCRILSTYDARSEISRFGATSTSPDLRRVLDAYEHWRVVTGGAISANIGGRLNVDALGKAYIAERAADCAESVGGVRSLLLNIGGDIVMRGPTTRVIGVADPSRPADNARPLTEVRMGAGAIATSGTSERGSHLIDPRTGRPASGAASGAVSATVIARDGVTANALATALCVLPPGEGMQLVDRTPGAAGLSVANGSVFRSARFAEYERPRVFPASAATGWATGYEVTITLTLKEIQGFRVRRPYVAVWAEDSSGKLVRNIMVLANKARWMPELHTWWSRAGADHELFDITKPTRPPGRFRVFWDGRDENGRPVPAGSYRITVETNREHGDYAKESGVIECGAKPVKITLKGTGEFEEVPVEYGVAQASV